METPTGCLFALPWQKVLERKQERNSGLYANVALPVPDMRMHVHNVNTQLTGNQANCGVEWCVVIFDRRDYPAELVRKGIIIKLGERIHQKTSVQSGLGDNGAGRGGDCILSERSCLSKRLYLCVWQLPSSVVHLGSNDKRLITPKNNRATVLMVDEGFQPFRL